MPTSSRRTVLVEPSSSGHRFQAVANVAGVATRVGEVLLMTSAPAVQTPAFEEFLRDAPVTACTVFETQTPSTRNIARQIAAMARPGDTVVLLDGDTALKRWWRDAPIAFGMRRRPRVIFMLTRYPARLRFTDWTGWRLRVPKALLALLAMATGSLHRVAGFSGRDDMSAGWLVKRTRDPAVCSASAKDVIELRARYGLPQGKVLVGVFGGIAESRKFPSMVWAAINECGIDADLLLAGRLAPEVVEWVASVGSPRIIDRDEFLTNRDLDGHLAAVDIVALVMLNNGPSGIQGKALAAGVPVVTAGSEVRAREVLATGGGEAAAFDVRSVGAAMRRALNRDLATEQMSAVPLATAEEFGEIVLGWRHRPGPRTT